MTHWCQDQPASGVTETMLAEVAPMSMTMRPPGRVKVWIWPVLLADGLGEGVAEGVAETTGVRDRVAEWLGAGVGDVFGDGLVTAEPIEVGSGGGVDGALVGSATATTRALGCSYDPSRSTRCTPNQDTDTAAAVAPVHAAARTSPLRTGISMTVNPNGLPSLSMATVLVVEDDPFVRSALIRHLTGAGHAVRSVGTALEALREVAQVGCDVVILDLGLPDLDGSEALKMIRGLTDVPVIISTARDDETEIVRLLNAGADDYLVKPFSGEHLSARMAAVLRRSGAAPGTGQHLQVGGLRIDLQRREVLLDGAALDLTRREFDLLAFLAARPGVVVSRRELLAEVWRQPYGTDQTIDVHLSWLRRKLGETASRPRYLHTVRGVGVRLDVPTGPPRRSPEAGTEAGPGPEPAP
ncbi:DNA-binding response OmpR family regulator [Streptacidiphilus sp. EB103A]